MITFKVIGRTVQDIERAIAEEKQAAGIPSDAKHKWDAEGESINVSTPARRASVQAGYEATVTVDYPPRPQAPKIPTGGRV